MTIEENIELAPLTTMKIGGRAKFLCRINNPGDLIEAFSFAEKNKVSVYVLGGGSNVVISEQGLHGLVVLIEIKGIEFFDLDKDKVQVIAGAGEIWDRLVAMAVEKKLSGLENLSGIPGTVGAAPVQNIGAYGAEVKNTLTWVEVFDSRTFESKRLDNKECRFAYRDSIFKTKPGSNLVITRVSFVLSKNSKPDIRYRDLENFFKNYHKRPELTDVRKAVLSIREKKFGKAVKHGTAGSFFKNSIIPERQFLDLKNKFPDLPGFPAADGKIKISTAWVIDKICGLKGFRDGKVGISPDQALVVINYGGADSAEIKSLADKVYAEVKEKTGIEIEPEVRFVE